MHTPVACPLKIAGDLGMSQARMQVGRSLWGLPGRHWYLHDRTWYWPTQGPMSGGALQGAGCGGDGYSSIEQIYWGSLAFRV